MAARLLDHLITLRQVQRSASHSETRVQPLKPVEVHAEVTNDPRYGALKDCLRAPTDDLGQAQSRAWELAHSLAEDHAHAHPWSLLMVAMRGALQDEDRYDAEIATGLDELDRLGVELWEKQPAG